LYLMLNSLIKLSKLWRFSCYYFIRLGRLCTKLWQSILSYRISLLTQLAFR
jgi:hypothetical protein